MNLALDDTQSLSAEEKAAARAASERLLVVFKDSVSDPGVEANRLSAGRSAKVDFIYSRALKGFAVTLPLGAVDAFIEAMERAPHVNYVEPVREVRATAVTQSGASWGLDRTDQRDLPLTGTYTYEASGVGVTAYVVDTGILPTHVEVSGRVGAGATAISDGQGSLDCNGHGTHVAGTLAGTTWGIAKSAALVPVRVLDCSGLGTTSGVIAGLDWITANARKPAVINLSLSGGASSALDAAVAKAVAAGITVVTAAGNDSVDACNASPAREPSALTVGASGSSDARAPYSNYGACLDLYAPGSAITSAWIDSTVSTRTISGTSMASPHVAGVAALMLQTSPAATPASIQQAIRNAASIGKVSDAGAGSPNLLLFAALPDGNQPAPQPTPVTEVSVGALTGSSVAVRNSWQARVQITLKTAVGGAVVTGSFSTGGSGLSCTTDAFGKCIITSGSLSGKTAQTVFTANSIKGTNLSYNAAANAVSTVTVLRP